MSSLTIHDVVDMDQEDPFNSKHLAFKQKQCPNSSLCGSLSAPSTHQDLLVVSNKYSCVLHATQPGFYYTETKNVYKPNQGVKHSTSNPVMHLELSSDELTLAVTTQKDLCCFSLSDLGTEGALALSRTPLKEELLYFGWHPHDPKTLLAMYKSKKSFTLNIETKKTASLGPVLQTLSSPLAYTCWDKRGNITTISEDGQIKIFSPKGEEWDLTESITAPSEFDVIEDEPAEVIWAKWVKEDVLCVGYSSETILRFVVYQRGKNSEFTPYSTLFLGRDEEPPKAPHFYVQYFSEWDIMTVSTNVSMCILNLKYDRVNNSWQFLEFLDGCSLENPEDQWCLGLAYDLTNTLPAEDPDDSSRGQFPPGPVLLLFTTDGRLNPHDLINKNHPKGSPVPGMITPKKIPEKVAVQVVAPSAPQPNSPLSTSKSQNEPVLRQEPEPKFKFEPRPTEPEPNTKPPSFTFRPNAQDTNLPTVATPAAAAAAVTSPSTPKTSVMSANFGTPATLTTSTNTLATNLTTPTSPAMPVETSTKIETAKKATTLNPEIEKIISNNEESLTRLRATQKDRVDLLQSLIPTMTALGESKNETNTLFIQVSVLSERMDHLQQKWKNLMENDDLEALSFELQTQLSEMDGDETDYPMVQEAQELLKTITKKRDALKHDFEKFKALLASLKGGRLNRRSDTSCRSILTSMKEHKLSGDRLNTFMSNLIRRYHGLQSMHDYLYPIMSVLPRRNYATPKTIKQTKGTPRPCMHNQEKLLEVQSIIKSHVRQSNQIKLPARIKRVEKLEELKRAELAKQATVKSPTIPQRLSTPVVPQVQRSPSPSVRPAAKSMFSNTSHSTASTSTGVTPLSTPTIPKATTYDSSKTATQVSASPAPVLKFTQPSPVSTSTSSTPTLAGFSAPTDKSEGKSPVSSPFKASVASPPTASKTSEAITASLNFSTKPATAIQSSSSSSSSFSLPSISSINPPSTASTDLGSSSKATGQSFSWSKPSESSDSATAFSFSKSSVSSFEKVTTTTPTQAPAPISGFATQPPSSNTETPKVANVDSYPSSSTRNSSEDALASSFASFGSSLGTASKPAAASSTVTTGFSFSTSKPAASSTTTTGFGFATSPSTPTPAPTPAPTPTPTVFSSATTQSSTSSTSSLPSTPKAPASTPTPAFGTPTFGGASFGAPSMLGGATFGSPSFGSTGFGGGGQTQYQPSHHLASATSTGFGTSNFGSFKSGSGFAAATGTGFGSTGFAAASGSGFSSSTGTGFGSTGFGSTSSSTGFAAATGFGSTGFGAASTGGFAAATGFGSTGFGAVSTGGFGASTGFGSTGFGAASGGFAAATGFGSTGFGAASSGGFAAATGFGSTGFGAASGGGFAAATGFASTSGFGTPSKGGFGATPSGFGNNTGFSFGSPSGGGTTGFGSTTSGFGSPSSASTGGLFGSGFSSGSGGGSGLFGSSGPSASSGFGNSTNTGFSFASPGGSTGFSFGGAPSGGFAAAAGTGFGSAGGFGSPSGGGTLGFTGNMGGKPGGGNLWQPRK